MLALAAASVTTPALGQASDIGKINHVVVIYQENWSFDSLYGHFPGANGLGQAGATQQLKVDGTPYTTNPQAIDTNAKPPAPDTRIPATLPVQPFDLSHFISPNGITGDIVHRYYQEQYQIDGGKNDRFLAGSDNPGLVLSYYDASNMPEGNLAKQYVMADDFFHSAFGGSFLNHQWLICACTPTWNTAVKPVPAAKRSVLDANGLPTSSGDGFITVAPDNFIVNTAYTVNTPHPKSDDPSTLVPNLTAPTIGDRLSAKGVGWTWFSGGWDQALVGNADPNFQYHHQPFAFYANYADGTAAKATHLKDENIFFSDAAQGTLPAVSFIKPLGPDNEHPGYATLLQGQQHVARIVRAIQNSSAWKDTAIIITYDENGGRYDHVAPPKADKWGPGVRVPTIIISPYARKGYVDHTPYETVSILKFIEERWSLQPLGTRDAAANDLTNAFDFSQAANASATSSGNGPLMVVAIAVVILLVLGVGFTLLRKPMRQA
jgi:acid phosphatase